MPRGSQTRGSKSRRSSPTKAEKQSAISPETVIHVNQGTTIVTVARKSHKYLQVLEVVLWNLLLDLLLAIERSCLDGHPLLDSTRALTTLLTEWLDQRGLLRITSTFCILYIFRHTVILFHCASQHRQHLGDLTIATTSCVAVGVVGSKAVVRFVTWILYCKVSSHQL